MRPKEGHHGGHKDNWEQRCCFAESSFDMLCARSILDNALHTHANGLLRRPTTIKKICTICKRCMIAFIHMAFISKLGFWRFLSKKAEKNVFSGQACIRKAIAEFEIFSVQKLSIILSEVRLECIWKKKHIYLQQKMHFNLLFQTFSEAHF